MSDSNRRQFFTSVLTRLAQAGAVTLASAAAAPARTKETESDGAAAPGDPRERADGLAAAGDLPPEVEVPVSQFLNRGFGFRPGFGVWRNGGWGNGGWRNLPWNNFGWNNLGWNNFPWNNFGWGNGGWRNWW